MFISQNLLDKIPEEIKQELQSGTCKPLTSAERDERRAKATNDLVGNLGYVDCPICKNKGYTASYKDGICYTADCACMKQRRTLQRISESGLQDLVGRSTFDTYETPKEWRVKAKAAAISFVRNRAGAWLVISGNSGAGKTHLCTAVCGELMKAGKEVRYMVWRDEAPKIKALVNERAEYERLVNAIKQVDVLYIDDFWKGTVTPADVNLAFEILNARYNQKRTVTLISTERTIEQMLDIDEAVGSRIYERSKGYYIKTPAENWRLEQEKGQ